MRAERIPVDAATTMVRILLFAAAFTSASCGRTEGTGGAVDQDAAIQRPSPEDRSGWFPYPGPDRLDQYADAPVGSGAGISDVLPIGRDLLISDSTGKLFLYHGELREPDPWDNPKIKGPAAAVAMDSANVYVADPTGLIRAYSLIWDDEEDASIGTEAWAVSTATVPDWILAVTGNLVCVSSEGGITVLSAADGSLRTRRDLGVPIIGKPEAADEILLVARSAGIAALGIPSLEFLWSGDRAPLDPSILWTVHDMLAFQDRQGALRVLDSRTGAELYGIPAGRGSAVVCDGERWYIAGLEGGLGAYGVRDGVPQWTSGSAAVQDGARGRQPGIAPRLAAGEGRLYLAGSEGLECWNSGTGELIERAWIPSPVDGLYITPGRLLCRMRDGTLRIIGASLPPPIVPDFEFPVRPEPAVADRIALRLEHYSESGSAIRLAWRPYIPRAAPSPDRRFTVFRYEVREAGNRSFVLRADGEERMLVAVFDASGTERYSNVSELGVDDAFEYWTEAGTWYVVVGNLRGRVSGSAVFLDIR